MQHVICVGVHGCYPGERLAARVEYLICIMKRVARGRVMSGSGDDGSSSDLSDVDSSWRYLSSDPRAARTTGKVLKTRSASTPRSDAIRDAIRSAKPASEASAPVLLAPPAAAPVAPATGRSMRVRRLPATMSQTSAPAAAHTAAGGGATEEHLNSTAARAAAPAISRKLRARDVASLCAELTGYDGRLRDHAELPRVVRVATRELTRNNVLNEGTHARRRLLRRCWLGGTLLAARSASTARSWRACCRRRG